MKEIGEELKQLRKKSGVDLEEASHDLNISEIELECIEAGNAKAFKDIYELKDKVRLYAKYLGVKEDRINDEFNDFLFEKTSKISKEDLLNAKAKEEKVEEKVSSPYTKIGKTRYDFAPIVLLIVLLAFIFLVVYLVLAHIKNNDEVSNELMGREVKYEFTE